MHTITASAPPEETCAAVRHRASAWPPPRGPLPHTAPGLAPGATSTDSGAPSARTADPDESDDADEPPGAALMALEADLLDETLLDETASSRTEELCTHDIWAEEDGLATAEYGIVMLAAVGFAGLLVAVLSSGEVQEMLHGIVERALSL